MKKELSVFLLLSAVLFLSACSDLSVDKDTALDEYELPKDFNWEIYGEINKDVKYSQIIFDVKRRDTLSLADRRVECAERLSNSLAKIIYLDYAGCPEKGWNKNEKCPGVFVNNGAYNIAKVTGLDTTWTCEITGCYYHGWNEANEIYAKCIEDEYFAQYGGTYCNDKQEIPYSVEDLLQDELEKYKTGATTPIRNSIDMMCMYILPQAGSAEFTPESYLKEFNYSSTLVKQHYIMIGRSEGRPYRHCLVNESLTQVRDSTIAMKLFKDNNIFYDYSQNTFCLDTNSYKIYAVR